MKNHFLICVLSFFALASFGQSSDATLNSLNTSTIQGKTYSSTGAYNMNAALISSKLNVDRINVTVQAYNASLAAIAAGTYTGSTSFTTLGTITTGVWNGTALGTTYGGTGLSSIGSSLQVLRVNAGGNGLEYA